VTEDLLLRTDHFDWQPVVSGWPLAAAILALVLALVLSGLGYWSLPTRRRGVLFLLRFSTLSVLALLLFGPVQVHSEGQELREPLVVLVDASRSMKTQDVTGQSRSEATGAWIAQHSDQFAELAQDYRLKFFLIEDDVQPWDGKGLPTSSGTTTDLGKALFGLQDLLAGERPGGVLLISDGADRGALRRGMASGGVDSAEILASKLTFPVTTWTIGSPEGPPDLGVELSVPPFGFVRRPLMLKATLHNRSLSGPPLEVILRQDGEIVGSQMVSQVEGEQELHFEMKPDRVGFHTYRIEVPALEGDAVTENNVAEATVKVIRDRTRILQVSSRPAWDVKYLRRLLKTDPNIDLVSFFILRNSDRRGPLTRSGDLSLIAFPYEELFSDDLQGFDLVIFQDFWFGSFTHLPPDNFLANIANYVREGGAFLMIGGDTSFGEGDYAGSVLDEVMPTEMPASSFVREDFAVGLAEAGVRHPVTQLDADEERNQLRWSAIPHLSGRNPLGPLRASAVSVLTAGPSGPILAAVRTVDRGRTMAFASDQSWRWGMSPSSRLGASRDHASFWRNAIRWLVKDARQEQVQVLLDRENYELGDEVQGQIRVLGLDYLPQQGVEVLATVGGLTGEAWQRFSATTDEGGQITFTTKAIAQGVMVASAKVVSGQESLEPAQARASVSERRGELENPRADPILMTALARGSGGLALEGSDPNPLDIVRDSKRNLLALERRVEPVWDRWWLLVMAVLPIAAEWTLRRRLGLR
jgi:uncharacterized membrane protein